MEFQAHQLSCYYSNPIRTSCKIWWRLITLTTLRSWSDTKVFATPSTPIRNPFHIVQLEIWILSHKNPISNTLSQHIVPFWKMKDKKPLQRIVGRWPLGSMARTLFFKNRALYIYEVELRKNLTPVTWHIILNVIFQKQWEKVKLSPEIDRIALMILTMTSFHHPQRPVSLQDKSMPIEHAFFK